MIARVGQPAIIHLAWLAYGDDFFLLTCKKCTFVKNIEFKRPTSKGRVEPTTQEFTPHMVGQLAYGVVILIEKVYIINVLFWVDPTKSGETGGKLASVGEFANTRRI